MWENRKVFIIIIISLFVVVSLIAIALILVPIIFKEERPPLDVPHATIVNYLWEHEKVSIPEVWIEFEVKPWGEISRLPGEFRIEEWSNRLQMNVVPIEMVNINTNDTLKMYEKEWITYGMESDREIKWSISKIYTKERWDLIILWDGLLARVTENVRFINNNVPIISFEYIKWEKQIIDKIFFSYYIKDNRKRLRERYELSKQDEIKWYEVQDYFQEIESEDFSLDVIGFGWVINNSQTLILNERILWVTDTNFQKKYSTPLEDEEKEIYLQKIREDRNRYFNIIEFHRYIYENDNLYVFKYTTGWNMTFRKILNWDFETFFFKNIEIDTPKKLLWWSKVIHNNMQFIQPNIFISGEKKVLNNELIMYPGVKRYKYWNVLISENLRQWRKESINDIYKQRVLKYTQETNALRSETLESIELMSSISENIGWFDGIINKFRLNTVNEEDFILIEYVLFSDGKYFTINFTYGEDEAELLPYFEELINSINIL